MKINRKYYNLVFSALIVLFMSFFMSLLTTIISVGLNPGFFIIWFKSYWFSVFVALPISIFVVPIIQKLIEPLFK